MPTLGGECANPIPRPKLKHLGMTIYKRNLAIAITLAALGAVTFRLAWVERRKKILHDYYETYDPVAHYSRMVAAKLMQSEMDSDE